MNRIDFSWFGGIIHGLGAAWIFQGVQTGDWPEVVVGFVFTVLGLAVAEWAAWRKRAYESQH